MSLWQAASLRLIAAVGEPGSLIQRRARVMQRAGFAALAVLFALLLLGGAAPTEAQELRAALAGSVAGRGFEFVAWELEALAAKVRAAQQRPAAAFDARQAAGAVIAYLERARRLAEIEAIFERAYSENRRLAPSDAALLRAELADLHRWQNRARPAVEQIIEEQVGTELAAAGLTLAGRPFPPVLFAFTDPPKRLVVSPRERIETIYYRMLTPAIDAAAKVQTEETIQQGVGLSAYVTEIGGLGAYPTMVVDRASLPWILSTVAHEWVHNYLTLYPLGLRYNAGPDLTTMNETVAEIVGNEIGTRVLLRCYEASLPSPPSLPLRLRRVNSVDDPPAFHFRVEMRRTREEVDRLLAAGKVAEAEAYMEARRLEFVARGVPLRVLNQAYFAFHGSYGTGPASTSPLGPQLEQLRELTPDLRTYLHTVRTFTSPADLEVALARWERDGSPTSGR